jgi:hypothetical protein
MTFGYDLFNDKRFANNHQSGSDYRILGTTSIITGSGTAQQIFPQFLGDGTTIIQWNPIPLSSRGSNFRTHSAFFNDAARLSDRLTLNLGVRWDKNDGQDQEGKTVITSNAWSPRLGLIYDPTGRGDWTVTASVARYVTAVLQSIADASSAGGNPETRQYVYRGPDINPPGAASFVPSDVAIRQLFEWYNANGGSNLPLNGNPTIPGVSTQIGDLSSPHTWEYATGVSRTVGPRASVRADFIYRNYHDFYIDRNAPGQRAQDAEGRFYDLTLVGNEDELLNRRYAGLTTQGTYRINPRVDVGGTYTVSRNWGNVGTLEGETVANGPVRFDYRYAEYKDASWNFPEGDLPTDQRHRARLWINVRPMRDLTLSVLQMMESGVPYGAANSSGVDPRPYVTNPGYLAPPPGTVTSYYFTARDAFRTEGQVRTDFAANYARRLPGAGRLELFGQLQILNLFNQSQLCACGGTIFGTGGGGNAGGVNTQRIDTAVRTPVTTATLAPFNPFTTTPVQGVNWDLGPNFGRAVSRFAYTTPQSVRVSFGVRF